MTEEQERKILRELDRRLAHIKTLADEMEALLLKLTRHYEAKPSELIDLPLADFRKH